MFAEVFEEVVIAVAVVALREDGCDEALVKWMFAPLCIQFFNVLIAVWIWVQRSSSTLSNVTIIWNTLIVSDLLEIGVVASFSFGCGKTYEGIGAFAGLALTILVEWGSFSDLRQRIQTEEANNVRVVCPPGPGEAPVMGAPRPPSPAMGHV